VAKPRPKVQVNKHAPAQNARNFGLEWFERLAEAFLVLWWVPAGHRPSVEEAKDRLARLRRDGPSPDAFTFRSPVAPRRSVSAQSPHRL
jgi:hypothetical protein